jgi:site-specific recombinase XerD
MGQGANFADISPEKVRAFLAGRGPLTATWHVKHNALFGLYRYAISRGLVAASPLPLVIPKRPQAFQPYIYSQTELRRLLDSTASYQQYRSRLEPSTVRALLLLMYGAALRTSEVLCLTIGDVDLANAVLTVRDSKFFKSRLVPLGVQTVQVLSEYDHRRGAASFPQDADASFFVQRNGKRVNIDTLEHAFQRIRVQAGLRREGGGRCQPRLHDLRHTSAVHRLTSWYREGEDVQKLLPQLSVYMGHAHLAATQVYLTMTPELLHEASLRFERYAGLEEAND